MCARVCVCARLRNHILSSCYNSEKNHKCRVEHFRSKGASFVYLIIDLQGQTFDLIIDLQGQTFDILFDLRLSRKWCELEQTLLLSSNRKSCLDFQLVYLHLMLSHLKVKVKAKVMHILLLLLLLLLLYCQSISMAGAESKGALIYRIS